jgi:hypothetical protein
MLLIAASGRRAAQQQQLRGVVCMPGYDEYVDRGRALGRPSSLPDPCARALPQVGQVDASKSRLAREVVAITGDFAPQSLSSTQPVGD